jgi:hypothetical protein
MIWQIDATVVDAAFWGMSFTMQTVTRVVVTSAQKKGNNSSFLHNIISPMPAVVRVALKGKKNRIVANGAELI